jgi:hypothetical protein
MGDLWRVREAFAGDDLVQVRFADGSGSRCFGDGQGERVDALVDEGSEWCLPVSDWLWVVGVVSGVRPGHGRDFAAALPLEPVHIERHPPAWPGEVFGWVPAAEVSGSSNAGRYSAVQRASSRSPRSRMSLRMNSTQAFSVSNQMGSG